MALGGGPGGILSGIEQEREHFRDRAVTLAQMAALFDSGEGFDAKAQAETRRRKEKENEGAGDPIRADPPCVREVVT